MEGRTGGGSKGGLVRKMLSPPVAEHTTVPSLASNHPITHTPPTRHSAEKSHTIITRTHSEVCSLFRGRISPPRNHMRTHYSEQ